jgi:hypothetical protein
MTSRRQHLEEMNYAIAHNLSLAQAKRRLAAERVRAAEAAIRNLSEQPIISGRELERRRRAAQANSQNPALNGPAPWMLRD